MHMARPSQASPCALTVCIHLVHVWIHLEKYYSFLSSSPLDLLPSLLILYTKVYVFFHMHNFCVNM